MEIASDPRQRFLMSTLPGLLGDAWNYVRGNPGQAAVEVTRAVTPGGGLQDALAGGGAVSRGLLAGDAAQVAGGVSNMGLGLLGAIPVAGGMVRAARGAARAGAEAAPGVRAFHGSPHEFDRFDMSKIGTGEGAQAYGHGLYFAENEGVARSYRAANQPYYLGADRAEAARKLLEETAGDRQQALVLANDRLRGATRYSDGRLWQDVLNNFDELTSRPPGRMYEVNLRVDPNRLLDWDAPLSQQPIEVRNAADTLRNAGQGRAPFDSRLETGADLYHALRSGRASRELGFDNWSTSGPAEYLRSVDIPGIRYLDGGSRGAGEGTRNYVIFDDSLIEILRKYGLAGLLAGGAAAGAASSAEAMPAEGR